MSVVVKICGFRDAEQVYAAVAAGVDAVGFVFTESIRQITPEQAIAISANVPAHVKRVAVMRHPSDDLWQDVLANFAPDVLQTDAEDFSALVVPDSVETWPVFREGGAPVTATGYYVYEGAKSGHGETVDWSRAAAIAKSGNMILAGGLAAGNVAEAIETVQPFGVDLSSAVESSPGQKDSQLIREFLSAVRAAEKRS